MDLSSLRALVVDLNFSAHGRDAVVTRPAPEDEAIDTRIVWITPDPALNPIGLDDQRFQPDFQRRDTVRMLALRRDEVPTAPRGTVIVTREWGSDTDTVWKIDGLAEKRPDHYKVTVIRVEE